MKRSISPQPDSDYLPIESYGVVGNLETVALVGINGSVDFMCAPHFDSPTIFSRLLDAEKGGYFSIRPAEDCLHSRQMYLPDTNILITRFHTSKGILEVIDFMPVGEDLSSKELVRIVKVVQGSMEVELECKTTFDYHDCDTHVALEQDDKIAKFHCDNSEVSPARLYSEIPLQIEDGRVFKRWHLCECEEQHFSYLCEADDEHDHNPLSILPKALAITTDFWRSWIASCDYHGPWQDQVRRSALVLKLLFSKEHGSMVAAPTFGLPEAIGGARNWDYRYCWIRDASFTVFALLKIGFKQEALDYVRWVTERYAHSDQDGLLNLMYRIDGTNHLEERNLENFSGYKGSLPVRIGNAANAQLQLDIYGELIDSIYLANKNGLMLSLEAWRNISTTVNYLCDNWNQPDEGIWEFRGEKKHFLHSRLMCWVALDRAIRISMKNSLPAPLDAWRAARDEIHQDILENFWSSERECFVQFCGTNAVDASTLMMPMRKFIAPFDPLWKSTLKAIEEDLVSDVFVKRYLPQEDLENLDGSSEGSFTMCSFWYCEILARSGEVEQATLLFEKMLGYANHLGLYSEELGKQGEHLGNFPQAFTHLALISTAVAINRAKQGLPDSDSDSIPSA